MMSQLTVDESVLLLEVITKWTPALIEPSGADKVPGVPPRVFAVKKMMDDAVTAVVEMVIVPSVIAALVPIEAFEPVAIASLFPAVPKTRFPLVAVIAPRVAVIVVPAVIEVVA